MVAFIDENEGNYNKTQDFQDERYITLMAIERLVSKLDKVLPETQKLSNPQLKGKATFRPYSGCYGMYPIGCKFCTKIGHNEQECPQNNGGKRILSIDSEEHDPKRPKVNS